MPCDGLLMNGKTRGWFYTLTVLAAALFDKPAYKNLIVNGLVLASDGRKMSKRLKNYPGEFHFSGTYSKRIYQLYMQRG